MLNDPASRISISVALAAETRSLFSIMLPSLQELQHDEKEFDLDTIRQGEKFGAALAIGTGLFVSSIAKDPLPLIVTAIITAGMVAGYERAITKPGTPAKPIDGG